MTSGDAWGRTFASSSLDLLDVPIVILVARFTCQAQIASWLLQATFARTVFALSECELHCRGQKTSTLATRVYRHARLASWSLRARVAFEYARHSLLGSVMVAFCIQNTFILHDVTLAPYEWRNYLTHPLEDFISLPWMGIIMEHIRHFH